MRWLAQYLEENGIRPILNYAAEDDVSEEGDAEEVACPHAAAERCLDRNAAIFMRSVRDSDNTRNRAFVAIKVLFLALFARPCLVAGSFTPQLHKPLLDGVKRVAVCCADRKDSTISDGHLDSYIKPRGYKVTSAKACGLLVAWGAYDREVCSQSWISNYLEEIRLLTGDSIGAAQAAGEAV